MLALFYTPGACSLATHGALREAGADFDLRRIDFGKEEQRSQDYLVINPKGRAPVPATERDILTETPAMLTLCSAGPAGHRGADAGKDSGTGSAGGGGDLAAIFMNSGGHRLGNGASPANCISNITNKALKD